MNERIRELALQAGIDFFNSTDPEYCGREYCEAWTEQQQKFAELIVRECLEVIESKRSSGENTDSWTITRDMSFHDMKQDLKEHFGVKE